MTELTEENPFQVVESSQPLSAAVATAHGREQSELQAMFAVAHAVGRDERKAWDRVMVSCERPGFAAGALYAFPRGGKQITGPSVQLAREIQRAWTGLVVDSPRIVEVTDDEVHIRAVAIDLISFNRTAMEDRFSRLIQRKNKHGVTAWVKPDERDLRELINRRAAIMERNCLLKLIPDDVVEAAKARIQQTMLSSADSDLSERRAEVVRSMVSVFGTRGVTREHLEQKIGRNLDDLTPTQLAELRGIYKSIEDGHTEPGEHFQAMNGSQNGTGDLAAKLAAKWKTAEEKVAADKAATEGQGDAPPLPPDPDDPFRGKAATAAASKSARKEPPPMDELETVLAACRDMIEAMPEAEQADHMETLSGVDTADHARDYLALLKSNK